MGEESHSQVRKAQIKWFGSNISALFVAKNLINKQIEKMRFPTAPLPKDESPSKKIHNSSSHVWLHPVVFRSAFQSVSAAPAPPLIAYMACRSSPSQRVKVFCFLTIWWTMKQLIVLEGLHPSWKKWTVPKLGSLEPGNSWIKANLSHDQVAQDCAPRPCSSAATQRFIGLLRVGTLRPTALWQLSREMLHPNIGIFDSKQPFKTLKTDFWDLSLSAEDFPEHRVAFCSTATSCCFEFICKPEQTFTAVVAPLFFYNSVQEKSTKHVLCSKM